MTSTSTQTGSTSSTEQTGAHSTVGSLTSSITRAWSDFRYASRRMAELRIRG